MSLSSRARNVLLDKINTLFAHIGVNSGTQMPKSTSNSDPIAYELWIASHLRTLAEKRYRNAVAAAVQAGVIFDKDKTPAEPGPTRILFTGDVVCVTVEVRQPTSKVDVVKMHDYLRNKGVKEALLIEAVDAATVYNKPAHVFGTMLLTNDHKQNA